MNGRANYQTCSFQCIRPGELWQCNWLEEMGTIVSLVYDIPRRITTLLAFSKDLSGPLNRFVEPPQNLYRCIDSGHWENPKEAHGDKRNAKDFERWRGLPKIGMQTDRHMLPEQADIVEVFRGKKGAYRPLN
jgi:hypothetical protein